MSFTSDDFNIYVFTEKLEHKGYVSAPPQLPLVSLQIIGRWGLIPLQKPAGVAFCFGERVLLRLDEFIADVKTLAAELIAQPDKAAGTVHSSFDCMCYLMS